MSDDPDLEARLGRAAAQVLSDPLDGNALRQLGHALVSAGEPQVAASALLTAARIHAIAGQLPMALALARELEAINAPEGAAMAEQLISELAVAYGRGSQRVDPEFRVKPPRYAKTTQLPSSAGLAPTRPKALDAVAAAEAAAGKLERGPLPRVPLFHALSQQAFRSLASLVMVRDCEPGQIVLDVGGPGDALFLIARGTVAITRPSISGGVADVALSHLRAGAFFGEMALLTDSPRTARATCETAAVLLEMEKRGLEELAAAEPEFAEVLADYTRDRLLHNLMLTSGVFASLDEAARGRLVDLFQPVTLHDGDPLLVEGQPGGGLFTILSGQVTIEKQDGADKLLVARLGPGDVVGEISLLTRRPATATVRASGHTLVLGLAREDWNLVAGQFPTVLAHLYQLANQREQDLERFLSEEVVVADQYLI